MKFLVERANGDGVVLDAPNASVAFGWSNLHGTGRNPVQLSEAQAAKLAGEPHVTTSAVALLAEAAQAEPAADAALQEAAYEAFRAMGMEEAAARAAAVGRDTDRLPVDLGESGRYAGPSMPPRDRLTGQPRAAEDQLVRHFRAMGLSEAGAEAAARGRD